MSFDTLPERADRLVLVAAVDPEEPRSRSVRLHRGGHPAAGPIGDRARSTRRVRRPRPRDRAGPRVLPPSYGRRLGLRGRRQGVHGRPGRAHQGVRHRSGLNPDCFRTGHDGAIARSFDGSATGLRSVHPDGALMRLRRYGSGSCPPGDPQYRPGVPHGRDPPARADRRPRARRAGAHAVGRPGGRRRRLRDVALRPVGRVLQWVAWAVFVWPWVTLWRYAVVPVGKALAWSGTCCSSCPPCGCTRRCSRRSDTRSPGWRVASAPGSPGSSEVSAPGSPGSLRGLGAGFAWVLRGIGAVIAWVYARVLTPLGRAVAWLLRGLGIWFGTVALGVYRVMAWLVRHLIVVPALWLYEWILAPAGRAIAWAAWTRVARTDDLHRDRRRARPDPARPARAARARPVALGARAGGRVLAVVAREVGDDGHAWRVAGHLSLAVGRFLGRLFRWIFVEPVRWVYRSVLTPVGHIVRDTARGPPPRPRAAWAV